MKWKTRELATAGDEPSKPVCRHCGAPLVDERLRAAGFCCAGCSYVFRLVHENGFGGYYQIKDDVTAPADIAVFQLRDYSWLELAQHEVEAGLAASPRAGVGSAARAQAIPELNLDVQGISCAGCVWLIEHVFQQQPGARDIFVNAQYGTMRLRWVPGEFRAAEFARRLQGFGYLLGPLGESAEEPESRSLVKRLGLCAAFAMNVMMFSLPTYFGMEPTFEWAGLFALLNASLATLSVLVGGTYFLSRAIRALREGAMHIDLPIAIGIVGAYLGSLYGWLSGHERFVYFDFVAVFILLMLIGRWAQVAAVESNRRRLLSQLMKPRRVRLAAGGEVPPEQLQTGQSLLLSSGQTLVVDARLESDEAAFSLASINGESDPRVYRAGQRVPAGAVNIGRAEVRLEARQPWSESLLARLLQAGDRPGERHLLLERIVKGYVVGILIVAAAAGAGWWLSHGDLLRTWAVVTAVLVVSCPCAVALAFPLADEMATIALRRRGVFVRENDLWPKLARIRQLIFDKTGTLTLENPVLQNPAVLANLDETARRALYALVRDNPHPVSQCLLENLLTTGSWEKASLAGDAGFPGEVREAVGEGVELGNWSLGRPGWRTAPDGARRAGAVVSASFPPGLSSAEGNSSGDNGHGAHDAELAFEGRPIARFRFVDAARPDARLELQALQARALTVGILSGDRAEKVASLARELDLAPDRALGGLSPQAKADWLSAHGADHTLMLGDGANDSLAFDRALCRGTPVIHRGLLEQKADFYYLGKGIGGLRALFEVDVVRRRTQGAILVFSVAYNLVAVGLAVAGRMNPLLAAILMPISSLITLLIVTSGMRSAFRFQVA